MNAVLQSMEYEQQEQLTTYEQQQNPKLRLSMYLDDTVQNSVALTQHGDSLINISKEVSSINNDLKDKSKNI